jgi:hypothetical protein
MVADEAPAVFAVVQEYGRRVDGRIAAWGMAFPDHADVISVDGERHLSLPGVRNAARAFHRGRHVRAHVMWVASSSG